MEPGVIKRLDEAVVNRIAAGEIIQRPANALKELIENSIDAGSTSISVLTKNGGLKQLQIQDNGSGIRKDDLGIVCERFTTSKLQKFDDLTKITTYGFRGEALASISHVAQLFIQTKTKTEVCAYKAEYKDGKLKADPKPCAGNQGTIITVEDLFYNVPQRKNVLKAPNEEFNKIYDVISKYAIHNSTISFTLKKHGEKNSIRTAGNGDRLENIRLIYGSHVTTDILNADLEDLNLRFKMTTSFTGGNLNTMKKGIFILFINHRLVESANLKGSLDNIYSTILPRGMHPFVYISLELDPQNVDVNVHPTKHEVHFLHEEAIVEKIKDCIEGKLLEQNDSRTFYTQSRLPFENELVSVREESDCIEEKSTFLDKTVYDKDLVRTDAKDQKLDKFFSQSQIAACSTQLPIENLTQSVVVEVDVEKEDIKETQLSSILSMRVAVEEKTSPNLRKILEESSFVGHIDKDSFTIQSGTIMFLCNGQNLRKELLYQILLWEFENYGEIELEEPLSVKTLALIGLDSSRSGWTEEDGPKEDLANRIAKILFEKRDMLQEYFGIVINATTGCLECLPMLIESHIPAMSGLGNWIIRITTEVDWDDEMKFFESFCRETADFYGDIPLIVPEEEWQHTMEHIFYPMFKTHLLPPESFNHDQTFLELAALSNLYKVFERC